MRTYDQAAEYMADGEWHTTPEIAKAIGKATPIVHRALMLALKYRCVEMGEISLVNSKHVRHWRLTP